MGVMKWLVKETQMPKVVYANERFVTFLSYDTITNSTHSNIGSVPSDTVVLLIFTCRNQNILSIDFSLRDIKQDVKQESNYEEDKRKKASAWASRNSGKLVCHEKFALIKEL